MSLMWIEMEITYGTMRSMKAFVMVKYSAMRQSIQFKINRNLLIFRAR